MQGPHCPHHGAQSRGRPVSGGRFRNPVRKDMRLGKGTKKNSEVKVLTYMLVTVGV